MTNEPAPNSRAIVLTEIEQMGGAERSVLALSRWLNDQGLAHHFVTYEDRADLAAHAAYPLTVVQLRPEMRARKKIAALRKYFASRAGAPRPLMSGYQPALHATLAGVHGFHTLMHDTPSLFDKPSMSLKARAARLLSNHIIAHGLKGGGTTIVTSEFLRDDCLRVFGIHADIARMGGLGDANAFQIRRVEGTLKLLSVSRIESNKRIDWILRALADMERAPDPLSSRVNWSLDIVGHGSQTEAMRALASQLGLAGRVTFHGYVSDEALERMYAAAHLFLMPAVQGYGIPAIEALTGGLPVLLHRESGVSDILLATPWATVITGGEEGMSPGLQNAIANAIATRQALVPLPELPTENQWAERVATLCGWL